MAHATGHDGDEESSKTHTDAETKPEVTAEALKNPEVQGKIKMALVKGGCALRERAETPGTRQALCKKLLDAMTAEERVKFIEDAHSWTHKAKEFFLDRMTGGFRALWKTAAPSILPEDWVTIESFTEEEVRGYIALGAVEVEEDTAKLVDGDLKDQVKALKLVSWLCLLVPDVGIELHEKIGAIAHLAEAPAAFLEQVLPEVRAEVRASTPVTMEIDGKRVQIGQTIPGIH